MGYRLQLAILFMFGMLLSGCGLAPQPDVVEGGLEAQAWTGTKTLLGSDYVSIKLTNDNGFYGVSNGSGVFKYGSSGRYLPIAQVAPTPSTGVIREIAVDSQNNLYSLVRDSVLLPTSLYDNAGEIRYYINKTSPDGQRVWSRLVRRFSTTNIYTANFPLLTFEIDLSDTIFLAIASTDLAGYESTNLSFGIPSAWFSSFSVSGELINSFFISNTVVFPNDSRIIDARARKLAGTTEWLILRGVIEIVGNTGFSRISVEQRSLDGALIDRSNYAGIEAGQFPFKMATVATKPFQVVVGKYGPDGYEGVMCISGVSGCKVFDISGVFEKVVTNPYLGTDFVLVVREASDQYRLISYRAVPRSGNAIKKASFTVANPPLIAMTRGSAIIVVQNIFNDPSLPFGYSQAQKFSATGVPY